MTGDPIEHVVVLILENHSFDQMLGSLRAVYPTLDGIDPATPRVNQDDDGLPYPQQPTTERQMLLDPHHEVPHVAVQMADGNAGFIRDFARSYPTSPTATRNFIMGYYPRGFLPALHHLAEHFTVCDHWFSSLPGPTWPNRFFALTGTSLGRVNMPDDGTHSIDLKGWVEQDQTTLFDRLTEQNIQWKIYFQGIPQSSVLCHQRLPHNIARYFYIKNFFADAGGAAEEFPQFCLIEPDYMGLAENDDHPPHDVMKAEKLIADIYNALRANEALWRSTLLVIFYDEHGGFYDHVAPPKAVPPDNHREEYSFDQLGLRVPAILVSPWVDRGVESSQFDHTSLLKYLCEKWTLGSLGERTAQANSLGIALRGKPRAEAETPRRIELTAAELVPPDLEREETAADLPTAHAKALSRFTQYLESQAIEGLPRLLAPLVRLVEWLKTILSGAPSQISAFRGALAEPDTLTRHGVAQKDAFTRYLMRAKRQAMPALAQRIRDENLPRAVREHAVQSLALLTKRPLHRQADRIGYADAWLRRRGH